MNKYKIMEFLIDVQTKLDLNDYETDTLYYEISRYIESMCDCVELYGRIAIAIDIVGYIRSKYENKFKLGGLL